MMAMDAPYEVISDGEAPGIVDAAGRLDAR